MPDNTIRHPLTANDALTRSAARELKQARPIKSETRLADYPRNATESERRFRFRWREGLLLSPLPRRSRRQRARFLFTR